MKPVKMPVLSPCVDICALDENDVCIGCYRHGNEISNWNELTNTEKQKVLEKTRERAKGKIIK